MKGWVVVTLIIILSVVFSASVFTAWRSLTQSRVEEAEDIVGSRFIELANMFENRLALMSEAAEVISKEEDFIHRYNSALEAFYEVYKKAVDIKATRDILKKPASFNAYMDIQEEIVKAEDYLLRRAMRFESLYKNNRLALYRLNMIRINSEIEKQIDLLNDSIYAYNILTERFPSNLVAISAGYFPQPYYRKIQKE